MLLHGEDAGAWPVLRLAGLLGLATRIGLEDTLALPDGLTGPVQRGVGEGRPGGVRAGGPGRDARR
ncbi:hypothetical protein SGLAM104S_03627 [Streptomyces glaucescens]